MTQVLLSLEFKSEDPLVLGCDVYRLVATDWDNDLLDAAVGDRAGVVNLRLILFLPVFDEANAVVGDDKSAEDCLVVPAVWPVVALSFYILVA